MELTLNQKLWVALMIDFVRELNKKIGIEVIKRYTRLNPQGLSARQLPPIPDKWTWRSGRLGRSVLGERWRTGENENIFEIKKLGGDEIIFTIGSKVIYSGVHEYGAVIHRITKPQFKSLPKRKFKSIRAIFTGGRPYTIVIPPRPYYRPALADMEREKWAVQVFEDVFKRYREAILKIA